MFSLRSLSQELLEGQGPQSEWKGTPSLYAVAAKVGPGLPPSASPRRGLTDLVLRTLLSHPSFLSYIVEGEGSSDTHISVSCLEGRGMKLDVNMPAANWYKRRVRSLAVPSTHLSRVLRGRSAPGGPSHPVAQHCAIFVRGDNILQLMVHLDSTWHQVRPPHLDVADFTHWSQKPELAEWRQEGDGPCPHQRVFPARPWPLKNSCGIRSEMWEGNY